MSLQAAQATSPCVILNDIVGISNNIQEKIRNNRVTDIFESCDPRCGGSASSGQTCPGESLSMVDLRGIEFIAVLIHLDTPFQIRIGEIAE